MNFKINNGLQLNCTGLTLAVALFAGTAAGGVGDTERVSVANDGAEGNGDSYGTVSVSEDGRFVAFNSFSDNLVDTAVHGSVFHVYVRDRELNITELVSINAGGISGNGQNGDSDISADGRYVAFQNWGNNLDTSACNSNGTGDIFVRDRIAQTTECISFHSDGLTVSNGQSSHPSVSGDGRFVTYASVATNLVDSDSNAATDIFVHDRDTGSTERISISSNGEQADGGSGFPDISKDGRFVVFESGATNLVPNDTNGAVDIFIHDMQDGSTRRISVTSTGTQADNNSGRARISADGNFVVFASGAGNLVSENGDRSPYIHNLQTGETSSVNFSNDGVPGDHGGIEPMVSGDGRFVAFQSQDTNLDDRDTLNDWNFFVRDRQNGTVQLVDVSSEGIKSDPPVDSVRGRIAISENGRFVAFGSRGNNLVPDDNNDSWDIFVHQIRPFTPQEMLEEIVDFIIGLNLDNGISNNLDAKLDSALNALADMNQNNDVAACNSLDALISAVEAQSGKKISVGDALDIIDGVLEVQAELGCG